MQRITADHVRLLNESPGMEPALLRWRDTGKVEIVPMVLFGDISYVHRNRVHEVVITLADLQSGSSEWNYDHPIDDDYDAWATLLNDYQ